MATTRLLLLCGLLLSGPHGVVLLHGAQNAPPAPSAARSAGQVTSRITVTLPQDDAELIVDGQTLEGRGPSRAFDTPPLNEGTTYRYTIAAQWRPNGYTTMTRSKTVRFRAGEATAVDLVTEDPEDRVRVIYVPTPHDVAAEMVRLARVTPDDVVYEPGCGDARITIAAIEGGAQRAICIDIEPERAEESRVNVRTAGLENRIDVRLGDALDVKDLSEVTVVFLYMGEHFNMLIRPVLWRDLKVGSRIVSHRFDMGDWEPDGTITVGSEQGGEYLLYVWTITEEVKRRIAVTADRSPGRADGVAPP
jgi:uncharacterized protein (TIGR03000 family)